MHATVTVVILETAGVQHVGRAAEHNTVPEQLPGPTNRARELPRLPPL